MHNVHEGSKFIGSIVYSIGATPNFHKPYALSQNQVYELSRIALDKHDAPLSMILAKSLRKLKRERPDIKLLVSYADTEQKHIGIIYQATNWIYAGKIESSYLLIYGKRVHPRTINRRFGTNSLDQLRKMFGDVKQSEKFAKYKYLMPLDRKTRKRMIRFSLPYPKRSVGYHNEIKRNSVDTSIYDIQPNLFSEVI